MISGGRAFGRWSSYGGGALMNELLSSLSVVSDSLQPQASLSFTIFWSLLKLTSIESMMPSNHLILCCPLLLLPSVFPGSRVFSNESALCFRWPKYWSFSFSISPSNEYSGLISFRIDWFDLLAVQGTLMSLLQNHNVKTWIVWCLAFFMVQLSHLYMTTGKTTALIMETFVSKVMFLLSNTLSRFVIVFFFFFSQKQASFNFMAGISALIKETVESLLAFFSVWEHNEKSGLWTRKLFSPDGVYWHLDLRFPKINIYCLSQPVCGIFWNRILNH